MVFKLGESLILVARSISRGYGIFFYYYFLVFVGLYEDTCTPFIVRDNDISDHQHKLISSVYEG